MKNRKNPFEEHAKNTYSGMYGKTKIHPVTEKNMPNIPPLKEEIKPKPLPAKSKSSVLVIVLVLIVLLFVGYFSHLVISEDPKETLTSDVKKVQNLNEYLIDNIVYGVINGIKDAIPERVVIKEKVKIVRVNDGQKAALEQVRAWERVNKKLIDEFYKNKTLSGQRSLCIKMGNDTQCTNIDTIDIRPELPGYLRRNDDSSLDLK